MQFYTTVGGGADNMHSHMVDMGRHLDEIWRLRPIAFLLAVIAAEIPLATAVIVFFLIDGNLN